MRTNPNIYDTEEAHNEIGQTIHDAKRRLLDSHKKGVPLSTARETFIAEVDDVLTRAKTKLNSPERPSTTEREAADSPACPIYPYTESGECPPDVSIDTVAEHMAHFPEWEKALLTRRAQIGNRDPLDVKNRACYIEDHPDLYPRRLRDAVTEAYNENDLDALAAAVKECEAAHEREIEEDDPPETKKKITNERRPLRQDEIEHCVATVIARGDNDDPRPYALALLLDEIAHDHTGSALSIAARAVLRTDDLGDALFDRFIRDLRPEYAHHPDHGTWTIADAVGCYKETIAGEE